MNIKDILERGFSGGFGCKSKIIIEIPTIEIDNRKEFDPNDIDDAIELFKRIVFNKKNLAYKSYQAMLNLNDPQIDLDDSDDFDKFEKERLKIINE